VTKLVKAKGISGSARIGIDETGSSIPPNCKDIRTEFGYERVM